MTSSSLRMGIERTCVGLLEEEEEEEDWWIDRWTDGGWYVVLSAELLG